MDIFNKYYNRKISMNKDIIKNILSNLNNNTKLLVFGLGYDSNLWYFGNNKNTYFIEHNQEYIDLNKDIPKENIIKYNYDGITVKKSFMLTIEDIDKYIIPDRLLNLAPFDIIIIDGPTGYNNNMPGRLLPIYWSNKYLSKSNTIIFIDDSERELEKYCIKNYCDNKNIEYIKCGHKETAKIVF
tara:strand:+ start:6134 stop:6685 length:552 start_codon:yes stop_codon:yes gene_type:complete